MTPGPGGTPPTRAAATPAALLSVVLAVSWMPARADIALAERVSGYAQMQAATQAMQDDDAANPAMLWVAQGLAAWQAAPANGRPACAGCHGDVATAMRGVAARLPAFDATAGRPLDLEQRIQSCMQRHQAREPAAPESSELLSLAALVSRQSRGLPIVPDPDARARPFRERGQAEFDRRRGQLDLSCRQCHDEHWGGHLGGSLIPQGHPTAYPEYRLDWQSLGSLQRRLRGCMAGVRSEPYAWGAPEMVDLELYLMWRARGMPLEGPGVRP